MSRDPDAVTYRVSFRPQRPAKAPAPAASPPPDADALERLASQLALALAIERAVDQGHVQDYSDAARRLRLSRARVAQLIALLQMPTSVIEAVVRGARGGCTGKP
ncbi:MAG: hypothetical protein JNJ88_20140 [Planctomycetes bacterium]|nr:hypothetical protein [Planctomycetota bacterium]